MSSVLNLLSIPVEGRTRDHLLEMLRCAVKLEHATLPPYLTAMWSVKDKKHPAYGILRSVVFEEMGHMGTVCNLLSALDCRPAMTRR
jgi:rubrerythrin